MKPGILISAGLILSAISCYEPYFTEMDSEDDILVVDGLITDDAVPYHIRLSYAGAYNSGDSLRPEGSATVYVTDALGNEYFFRELSEGDYVSDPADFTGSPGNTYVLHIITEDNEIYISEPQQMLPEVYPDSLYAQFDQKEILDKATGVIVTKKGANIYADLPKGADTLRFFRFTSELVSQYIYFIDFERIHTYYLYCWQTQNANSDINLTGGEFTDNFVSIKKHTICFIEENDQCFARTYVIRQSGAFKTDYFKFYTVHNLIIYFHQYALNSETSAYYKSMDEQIRSEEKIFDPIALQLHGNVSCLYKPERTVLGHFEASSVSHFACKLDFRNLDHDQPLLVKVPYILPGESEGCLIDEIPAFWVN